MVAHVYRCFLPHTSHPNSVGLFFVALPSDYKRSLARIASPSSASGSSSLSAISAGPTFPSAGIFAATSTMGADAAAQDYAVGKCSVRKSPSDEREYEVVHLPNGLCALLVHDPRISDDAGGSEEEEGSEEDDDDDEFDEDDDDDDDIGANEEMGSSFHCESCLESGMCEEHGNGPLDTFEEVRTRGVQAFGTNKKMAAAALAVGVGSFSDPEDAQGLAHFLEHMLFMGSSKYPDENEYDNFLSKHGGSSNAYTDTEHTCYYFEVNHKFLKPALDRFSQFFISPSVKAEAMEREVQAVDSEFEGHLQSDTVRLSQLQCHTAHQLHPFNCFSWGNRKSLSEPVAQGVNMRSKLLKMYKDHYFGGRMKLTVIGGEPLETLKEWVIEQFSGVRSGGEKQLRFPWEGPIWESGKIYRIKSVKDQHFVSIIWPFPCLREAYLKKSHDYISHLVGHEGVGSLLSMLKLHGWATDLSAGIGDGGFERSSTGYMFNVTIYLTDSGLEKVEEVVGLLYQYLKLLRKIGPQAWVFKELQAMTNMEFKFVEEEHADDYAVNLATNMHLYLENHIIYGDYALEVWDPDLVQILLNLMVPGNMRLDIVTKSFDGSGAGVQHEPWFGVPYTVEDVPSTLMKSWADPMHIDPMLHMPVVNEFIPSDFSLREVKDVVTNVPKLLIDEAALRLWYKLDQKFKMPRANAYFLISCKGAYDNVKAAVLTELFVKLIKDALNETLYLANVARLESSLSVAADKIEIKIHGFNEKLPLLASKISYLLKNFAPSINRFEVIKEELQRGYTNFNMKPLKHATYLRMQILRKRFWPLEEKIETLSSLSLEDMNSFISQLLSQIHIEALCHGNLLEDEAMSVAKIFRDHLVTEALPTATEPKESVLKLPAGTSLVFNTDAKNMMEENSAVQMYFQLEQDTGEQSVKARAIYDLVETIVYEPCFNELRTREQLGYTVSCSARMTCRILGFCFRVLSAKFSPSYIKHRIDTFVSSLESLLEGMGDDEFENYVEALIESKLESDHSLVEETDRYWVEIVDRRYLFDINKLEAEELRRISKLEVVEWYRTFLCTKSRNLRKLSIFIWGSNARAQRNAKIDVPDIAGETVNVIEDVSMFKLRSDFFMPLC